MKNDNSINNKACLDEKLAYELKRKAESKVNPDCCIDRFCTSKKSLLVQSRDLYIQSAEIYKNCLQWRKAGECYEKCAIIKMNLNESPIDAYKESIFCYKNVNSDVNIKIIFFKMINYLESKGEIYLIAKNYEEMGDYYQNKGDKKEAKYFYEEAIKNYSKDSNYENDKINLQKKLTIMKL
jgi:tetratricopeptide (TPR) repeat protein